MSWCDGRRAAARAYAEAGLGELVGAAARRPPAPRPPGISTWSATRGADELVAALATAGIGARGYYRAPAHLQPAMREFAPAVPLPGTDGGRARRTWRSR